MEIYFFLFFLKKIYFCCDLVMKIYFVFLFDVRKRHCFKKTSDPFAGVPSEGGGSLEAEGEGQRK